MSNSISNIPQILRKKWLTTNPDEMIKQLMQDLKSDDRKTRKRWEHIVKTWYVKLYNEAGKTGKSTLSVVTYLNRVMSFFSRNEVALRFRRKELPRSHKKLKSVSYRIEDLKIMHEHCESLRNKAILLTLVQSGLSEVDLCKFNIEDIPNFYEKLEKPPVYIEGHRQKTKMPYQTCIGEDACICIKRMLNSRGNPKEGALFISHKKKRLTSRCIHEALNGLTEKLVEAGHKQFEGFQTRHLRDLFDDAVARARLSQKTEDRLMGHKLAGARADYLLAQSTIVEGYLSAYRYLHACMDNLLREQKLGMK